MARDDITAWIRERITAEVLIAFVLGVVLGLVVLGWWLWPVQWSNSNPADLKLGHKESYIQLTADSYALTGNAEVARARLETLKVSGEKDADLAAILARLSKTRTTAGDSNAALRLQGLAKLLGPVTPTPTTPAKPAVTKGTQWLRIAAIVFFLLLLVVGVVLLLLQLLRRQALRRRRAAAPSRPFPEAPEVGPGAVTPAAPGASLGHFETTYNLGDESYDVSYSVESSTGEFLGECGISALETLDTGQPDNVAAFEVWLFDKNDVRTETKIWMSERAYGDALLRERLTDKGELVKADKSQIITLETANLRLAAAITELAYESNSDSGIFAKLTTHLEVSTR